MNDHSEIENVYQKALIINDIMFPVWIFPPTNNYFIGFIKMSNQDDIIIKLNQPRFSKDFLLILQKFLSNKTINFTNLSAELIAEIYNNGEFIMIEILSSIQLESLYTEIDNDKIVTIVNLTGIAPQNEIFIRIVKEINHPKLYYYCQFIRYYNKIDCECDLNKIFEISQKDHDENKRYYALAICYLQGIGCDINKETAIELFQKDWDKNKFSSSLHQIAQYHEEKKEFFVSFELFQKNWSENKNFDSLYSLAQSYEQGQGCNLNYIEAFRLHKINWTKNKHIQSLCSFARFHEKGIGCKRNEEFAFELYKIGYEHKNPKCTYNLAEYYLTDNGDKYDEKKGFELHQQNWNENKFPESLLSIAECYENGYGCIKDTQLAIEIYQQDWQIHKRKISLKKIIDHYKKLYDS